MVTVGSEASLESRIFQKAVLAESPRITSLLHFYVDLTGSQQYWDFFAPHSPKYHQYLSVCGSVASYPNLGKIVCKGEPYFSNLVKPDSFSVFGSDRSRLYRLTENLAKLEDPNLLFTFAQYYRMQQARKANVETPVRVVLHEFELHPELIDLPKSGYRMDKVIWQLP